MVKVMPMKNTDTLRQTFSVCALRDAHERQTRKTNLTPVSLNLLASKPQREIFRSLEIKVTWKRLRSGSWLFPWGRGSELLITACSLRAARSKKHCTHDDAERAWEEQKGARSPPKATSRACNFILRLVLKKVNGHWGNQRCQWEQ